MNSRCAHCGLPFERESGFYLGAIYFNYGLTALIVAIGYPMVTFSKTLPESVALVVGLAFAVVFPIAFFRHARSLWLGLDECFDPYRRKSEGNGDKADLSHGSHDPP